MTYSSISDQDLVLRCAESRDDAAWREFLRRYHRLIARVAYRTARRWGEATPAVLEELVQDMYAKLCDPERRILADFQPRHAGAFPAYLGVITANLVNDHFKSQFTEKHGLGQLVANGDEQEASASDSGAGSASAMEGALLRRKVDEVLRGAPGQTAKRDRQIFWLYYRQGMSAREISSLPLLNLTIKGVESSLQRATRLVRLHLCDREPGPQIPQTGFLTAGSL